MLFQSHQQQQTFKSVYPSITSNWTVVVLFAHMVSYSTVYSRTIDNITVATNPLTNIYLKSSSQIQIEQIASIRVTNPNMFIGGCVLRVGIKKYYKSCRILLKVMQFFVWLGGVLSKFENSVKSFRYHLKYTRINSNNEVFLCVFGFHIGCLHNGNAPL